jgi:RNA polymerase sigma-70 factor (ECF subfamily)
MVNLLMDRASDDVLGVGAEPDEVGVGRDPADIELERRFAAGDEHALRDVYGRYGTLVHSFCRRSVGTEAAADATQETFVTAWRRRDSFDPARGSLGGWLMGIARFKALDVLRKEGRAAPPAGAVAADPAHAVTQAPSEIDSLADRMLLAEALDQLPPRARTVVELAAYHDLTHTEIAERCGLPLGTVKSDLRRSLARLRHYIHADTTHPDTIAEKGGNR